MDRLIKGIRKSLDTEDVRIDYSLFKKIPRTLREHNYSVCAVLYESRDHWQLVDLIPPENERSIFGIAVDLGTSTVVARLVDLNTHNTIDEISFHNPRPSP